MLKKYSWFFLFVILTIVLVNCAPSPIPDVTPTRHLLPTNPPQPVASSTSIIPTDDVLSRIQSAGKMKVGVSADYPPFTSYDPNFKLDGFDIALMWKISEILKVKLDYKDMAFEGLPAALESGQIDAAIAAISITPDREQVLDFSSVYLVSSDAILGRKDAPLSAVKSVDDLAPFRLGVEKGSIYEKWLRTSLVDAKKMRADRLQAYTLPEQALKDLQAGRVDFVAMDYLPAQTVSQQFGLKIVGQDLNRQYYAIAFKPGSASLQNALNQALSLMQKQGQIAALAKQYLNINDLLPTPTPQITPTAGVSTPLPPNYCNDSMAFVGDVNLPDYNMSRPPQMNPNTPFAKGWRIQNTGTCTWTPNYSLAYSGSYPTNGYLSGQPVRLQSPVPPGGTLDLYAGMITPPYPGIYQSFWVLRNANNQPFGSRLYALVQVLPATPPPPPPTAIPDPGISFSADKNDILSGDPVNFTWNAPGASQVFFGMVGAGKPARNPGTDIDAPVQSSIYELRILYPNGSQKVRQIQIRVLINPIAPVITRFDMQPQDEIVLGDCVDLSWEIVGNVSRVTLTRNRIALSDGSPASSSYHDCPDQEGDYTYTLTAQGDRDSTIARQYLRVSKISPFPTFVPGPTDEPIPTFVPEPTEEPLPTFVPEPTEEPIPTFAPEPTDEPLPTDEPIPTDTDEPMPTDN